MPENVRQTNKRELVRAHNNIDMALKHVYRVAKTYRDYHPEISEGLDMIAGGLVTAQDALTDVGKSI